MFCSCKLNVLLNSVNVWFVLFIFTKSDRLMYGVCVHCLLFSVQRELRPQSADILVLRVDSPRVSDHMLLESRCQRDTN